MLLSKSHPTKSLLLDREIYDLSFTAQPGDEPCPKIKYENFSQTQARCSTEVHMLEQKTTDQNIIAAVIQHPHCNCLWDYNPHALSCSSLIFKSTEGGE